MTYDIAKAFIDACEGNDIKTYSFRDDTGVNYYNNERGIIIITEDGKFINIRPSLHLENLRETANASIIVNDLVDIRSASVQGNFEEISAVLDTLGITLTDEQRDVLVKIDRINLPIIPMTGDYHNIFHKLSQEEYDALTPEEKAKYDAAVAEEEKRYNLAIGIPAQITV